MPRVYPDRTAEVRAVLTQPERSAESLSAELGLSGAWVRRVRRGIILSSTLPELPREPEGRMRSRGQVVAMVRDVLTSGLPKAELARRYGVTASAIDRIAIGRLHARVCPELPRRTPTAREPRAVPVRRDATCCDCRLFDGGVCSIGIPEGRRSIRAGTRCPAFYQK